MNKIIVGLLAVVVLFGVAGCNDERGMVVDYDASTGKEVVVYAKYGIVCFENRSPNMNNYALSCWDIETAPKGIKKFIGGGSDDGPSLTPLIP